MYKLTNVTDLKVLCHYDLKIMLKKSNENNVSISNEN